MQWLNPPAHWSQTGDRLTVRTAPRTDFWRITHYGFIRDTGHFYYEPVSGNFTLDLTIQGQYRDRYDQAGIMLRVDDQHWIKTGIEYVDGVQYLSAVVTHNYSDWSVQPLPPALESLRLRVEKRNEAIEIFYATATTDFSMFRLTYLPSTSLHVGLMCASPDGDGFEVAFTDYCLTPNPDGHSPDEQFS